MMLYIYIKFLLDLQFFYNFKIFLIYLLLGIFISLLLLLLNQIFAPNIFDKEKVSAYECGFDPFDDARISFNIHYYVIAIFFIIFDAEIIFLFPWTVAFSYYSVFTFPLVLFFLLFLTIGFILEWFESLLKW